MRPSIFAAVAFCAGASASAAEVCAAGEPCDGQEAGDDSFAAAQLRTLSRPRRAPPSGALRKLGLLGLDGYYWPTQPGDVNDLRTWCTVKGVDGDEYKCISPSPAGDDEFGLSINTIAGGTWGKIQGGKMDGLEKSFVQAVEQHLLDPSVHALMGNTGWFAWYQYPVSKVMRFLVEKHAKQGKVLKRKPWLGGSPAMVAAVGSLIRGIGRAGEQYLPLLGWELLEKPNDKIMMLTSNADLMNSTELVEFLIKIGIPLKKGATLAEVRATLRKAWHIRTVESDDWTKAFVVFLIQMRGLLQDMDDEGAMKTWMEEVAHKIVVVPWKYTLGYGLPVTSPGAMFHNVPAVIRGSSVAASELLGALYQETKKGFNVVGIIMESTEMPAYANWVRYITELPVWDSTVVGKCLMAAAPDFDADLAQAVGNSPVLFNTPSFHQCMMSWWNHTRYEKRAGFQENGDILHYDNKNLTTDELDKLTCTGGRPAPGKLIGRLMSEFDTGRFAPSKVHASCLSASPCAGRTWQGENCPVSGSGGMFSSSGGCLCPGNCPAGYYCGGDEAYDIAGLEGVPGGQGYIYGVHGDGYANYTGP